MTAHPLQKPGVRAHAAGEEWFLHDGEQGNVHVINATAKFIWDLCDGTNSAAEIEAAVRAAYAVRGEEDVLGMVEEILGEFAALGILAREG